MVLTTYQERALSTRRIEVNDYVEDTTVKTQVKVYRIGQDSDQSTKKNIISSTYGKYIYRDISLSKALLRERAVEKDKENRK